MKAMGSRICQNIRSVFLELMISEIGMAFLIKYCQSGCSVSLNTIFFVCVYGVLFFKDSWIRVATASFC